MRAGNLMFIRRDKLARRKGCEDSTVGLGAVLPNRFLNLTLGFAHGSGADGTFAHERCTFFDGKSACDDVAFQHGIGLQLAALGDADIALNATKNHDGFGANFANHERIFTHSQAAVGAHFTLDLAINDEIVGKFETAFDFDVAAENVFIGAHELAFGGCGSAFGFAIVRWFGSGCAVGWFNRSHGDRGFGLLGFLTNDLLKHGELGSSCGC